MTTKTDLLQRWYDEVWVHGNLDAIDKFFVPDLVATGIVPEMQMGRDDFQDLVVAFRAHVGEIDVRLPKTVEHDDWLAAFLHVHTTRADNGAPIEVTGQVMARFEGDQIVEAYNQFDFVSLFEQLGQLPEDTIPICMTGQQLEWA
ncbi:ester cyclase [Phaeobacter marinintestinus]|uniref:ester cyclase n=1 Tax=Falsiphaeobacter marinintestinus TaxID=1492905 RepID=UPI0011B5E6F0|nr:ester cyclase [Phaeobacter marinintestinus]